MRYAWAGCVYLRQNNRRGGGGGGVGNAPRDNNNCNNYFMFRCFVKREKIRHLREHGW